MRFSVPVKPAIVGSVTFNDPFVAADKPISESVVRFVDIYVMAGIINADEMKLKRINIVPQTPVIVTHVQGQNVKQKHDVLVCLQSTPINATIIMIIGNPSAKG